MPFDEQSVFLGILMELGSIGDGSLVEVEFSWKQTSNGDEVLLEDKSLWRRL